MKKLTTIAVIFITFMALIKTGHCAATDKPTPVTERKEVQQFIQQMVTKHQFDQKQLTNWLNQANIKQSIIDSISKPAEGLPWFKYKKIFITPNRIESGVAFWQTHQKALQKAATDYGVPEEIIVAIIGVETFYGKYSGGHRVLDALTTLAFDYPPRSSFFKKELEEFLLLTREENWDPTTILGSYAGAMGKPQFIASSYRHYAVDFNKTGQRDLLNSTEDSIGSVANYFKRHGWKKNQPIIIPATIHGEQYKELSSSQRAPKPSYTLKHMADVGVGIGGAEVNPSLANEKFALVTLESESGLQHWLGLENFYVITRYNHSNLYAMAVYELSEKIKSAYNKGKAEKSRT